MGKGRGSQACAPLCCGNLCRADDESGADAVMACALHKVGAAAAACPAAHRTAVRAGVVGERDESGSTVASHWLPLAASSVHAFTRGLESRLIPLWGFAAGFDGCIRHPAAGFPAPNTLQVNSLQARIKNARPSEPGRDVKPRADAVHGGKRAGGVHGSDRVRAFDTAAHALDGPLLKPVLGFLDVGQRAGVGLAGIRPLLEAAQPVGDDGEQHFMGYAVDAGFGDRAVLEQAGAGAAAYAEKFCAAACTDKPLEGACASHQAAPAFSEAGSRGTRPPLSATSMALIVFNVAL